MSLAHAWFESLESRQLLSAATLQQDQAALDTAIAQLKQDQIASDAALKADRLAIKGDGKANDPTLAPLRLKLKQDRLARDNTLLQDRLNLRTTLNNDEITIIQDRLNIRTDKAADNVTQLATDKQKLSDDKLKLAQDRKSLGDTLENDRISSLATITADQQAIVDELTSHSSNTQLAQDEQQLESDKQKWVTILANDRKTIFNDRLIVAQDKHG